jgi:hypothetical protein
MKTEKSISSTELSPGERKSFDSETGRWYVKRAYGQHPEQIERVRVVFVMEGRGPTDVQLLGSMASLYMKGATLQDLCKRYKYWDRSSLRKRIRILTNNLLACGGAPPPKLPWKDKEKRKAKRATSAPQLLKVSKRTRRLLDLFDEILLETRSENPTFSKTECRSMAAKEAKQRTRSDRAATRAREKQALTTQPIFEIPSDEPKSIPTIASSDAKTKPSIPANDPQPMPMTLSMNASPATQPHSISAGDAPMTSGFIFPTLEDF